jgi:hypothetical protein
MNHQIHLQDGAETFTVSVFSASLPKQTALFAVGGGGNPERHAALLTALAGRGCTVVAPHFERMAGHVPGAAELVLRVRRLRLALDHAADAGLPLVAAGHSIGAAMLIGLAGGKIGMPDGRLLQCEADERIKRLAVFAPAMDFFAFSGALDGLHLPVQVWAGALDSITPPWQMKFACAPVDYRLVEGAGHFSFMNQLPPHIVDTLEDRETFLSTLAAEVGKFLLGQNN